MAFVNFGRKYTRNEALSSTNLDKIFFPTDSTSIIMGGKEYGAGVAVIERTSGDGAAGTTDTYTMYSDAAKTTAIGTFNVYNGSNGTNGTNGTNATTTDIFSSSANGLAPSTASGNQAAAETSQSGRYLCSDGKWRYLPTNAFNDTTYSVMGASGSSHASGLVPDPGSTAGTAKYLREDGTWAEPSASVSYAGVTYGVNAPSATSGAISVNFNTAPVHVITLNGNASSVTVSNLTEGHCCHIIFVSSSSSYTRTVAIAYNATSSITPNGAAMSLTVPKSGSGYVEVDFIKANSKTYVRGI